MYGCKYRLTSVFSRTGCVSVHAHCNAHMHRVVYMYVCGWECLRVCVSVHAHCNAHMYSIVYVYVRGWECLRLCVSV